MIWLTWRQLRAGAAMLAAALAALALLLAVTGPGLSDDFSKGSAACVTQNDGCSQFFQTFYHDNQALFLITAVVVMLVPALVGLFWGAPLIARELEAGTHRLVWNQSITRTRWLAVKLGLTGLAAMVAAGIGGLAVTWWAGPVDKAAAGNTPGFPRLGAVLFPARGIVPIGYAAFAFALGVALGMLIRRTLPAMAITLTVFAALQVAMPLLLRPHLIPAQHSYFRIDPATNVDFMERANGGPLNLTLKAQVPTDTSAWVLSQRLVDKARHTVHGALPLAANGPCNAPPPSQEQNQGPQGQGPGQGQAGKTSPPGEKQCFDEIDRLGYRQEVTYQPSSRFWTFQVIETGIYTALAALLAGFSFWWIRRRLT
ncbi:ABC transporter permease subunit [Actinomadura barringtoniae]|uniref:ABC transporter permease subunit n=1 Tax=Actinomadura barringtoniae TaxID=1427535 RepID=A0A939PR33_9ACTN|nr:ABC transporter permease subunit [Actinomadura barringtoniae]MBO2454634.1 ABC transporter permease subunit [Actinomadura barringtoniae]